MMYFKTILIAVMAVNFFETYCQPLEQGNILKCYTSDGWHDAELNNKKTCNGEKCFGFFNFPDWNQTRNVGSSGCNIPKGVANYIKSYLNKSEKRSGKANEKIRLEISGLTLHAQSNSKNTKEFFKSIENGGKISSNANLNLQIDGVKLEAKANMNSQFPGELPTEVEVCIDQKCEAMQIEEIIQQILSGGKLTITFGPLNFESSVNGDINRLIKKFNQKPDEEFKISLSSDLYIDDFGSLKLAFHGSTSANELVQKYKQFYKIYENILYKNILYKNYNNVEDLFESIISEFDDVAANICIEGDCLQFGTCSEDLCNTQEYFIEKANFGVTLRISLILLALSLSLLIFV